MIQSVMVLIAAHVFGDFVLQPDWLKRRKVQYRFLLLHGGIHAGITYLLYQSWHVWTLPLAVFVIHISIDGIKQKACADTARVFAFDQLAHLISLYVLALSFLGMQLLPLFEGEGYEYFVLLAGFIATVWSTGHFVGKVAEKIKKDNNLIIDGLHNGGALIGKLERALIFLLILINQPAGIGFLVAAKSILRFEEAKKQKVAEYVLIGTLSSFSLAIAIAYVTKLALWL